ncbi:MAG: GNAT family N-acetyltransferase [Acidimicrobiia bacterium]|nr:GNAT family N-acetyltransferase [Acidimicrobiia bacterium]
MSEIVVQRGFADALRNEAAAIYDEAFERQLSIAIRDGTDRRALLAAIFDPQYCFAAFVNDRLVGLAGMHTEDGSFTGGALSGRLAFGSLREHLSPVQSLRAAFAFNMHRRTPQPNELLMDGIAVAEECRGLGVGTKLLDAIEDEARRLGRDTVRLNVTDVNAGARALYERVGFREVAYDSFPYMRRFLGFGGSATMELAVRNRT